MNPEKETAFPMSMMSLIIKLEGFKKNWKKIFTEFFSSRIIF